MHVTDIMTVMKCKRFVFVVFYLTGRRSCLGELLARQEMFLFIAGLAQSFDILPPEGQDHVDISDILGITLAPKPFNVRLVARR